MAIQKLTRTEFFTVYGISLLLHLHKIEESDLEYLSTILSPIAEKYSNITRYALNSELRHFMWGGYSQGTTTFEAEQIHDNNTNLLNKLGISWNRDIRKTLSTEMVITLFDDGAWNNQYGGKAWGNIAKAYKALASSLPVTRFNLAEVIMYIDRLNDLEHNNSSYLETYSTFNLHSALYLKGEENPKTIINHSKKEVRELHREYSKNYLTSRVGYGIVPVDRESDERLTGRERWRVPD